MFYWSFAECILERQVRKYLSLLLIGAITLSPSITSAKYGIYYATNATYAKRTAQNFDMMIIQPYNYHLYANYTGKKICYLTVGEFDGTATELTRLWLDGAKIGRNTAWNSFLMNMSSPLWQDYLLKEERKLKAMGCHGLFLDTIWQDGQEAGWIAITKKLRENWKEAYIMPNNAHNIKKDIVNYVDAYMFENFWDKTVKDNSQEAKWLLTQMQEYNTLKKVSGKWLLAISYGNPFISKIWGEKTKKLAIKYGFEEIYTNEDITTIHGYLDNTAGSLSKLPVLKQ